MRLKESVLSEGKSQCHQVLISDAAISAGDVCLICKTKVLRIKTYERKC